MLTYIHIHAHADSKSTRNTCIHTRARILNKPASKATHILPGP